MRVARLAVSLAVFVGYYALLKLQRAGVIDLAEGPFVVAGIIAGACVGWTIGSWQRKKPCA